MDELERSACEIMIHDRMNSIVRRWLAHQWFSVYFSLVCCTRRSSVRRQCQVYWSPLVIDAALLYAGAGRQTLNTANRAVMKMVVVKLLQEPDQQPTCYIKLGTDHSVKWQIKVSLDFASACSPHSYQVRILKNGKATTVQQLTRGLTYSGLASSLTQIRLPAGCRLDLELFKYACAEFTERRKPQWTAETLTQGER